MNRRPLAVTILGCVYIAMGVIGFAYHFRDLDAQHLFDSAGLWVELVRVTALVCGVYMLRGHNWARWLALAWMAFHVVVSAFHALTELAIHIVFFAIIAYFLFRPEAIRYFQGAKRAPGEGIAS